MECAALFSPLVIQSLETSSGYGFEERRVRPWPPVVCSPGTTPIQAANSRPLWKAPPLPIAAMSAVARDWTDARNRHEPSAGFVLIRGLSDHRIGLVNPHSQLIKIQLQLGQQHAHCAR